MIAPPNSMTVNGERRVVIYDHLERPYVRQIGYRHE